VPPEPSPRDAILAMARDEGFAIVRIAPAAVVAPARARALAAHAEGQLAGLGWMTPEWLERATDPGRFLEGARSVVMLALPYARAGTPPADGVTRGRIAAYAAGRDYHRTFEARLRRLARRIREEFAAGARPTVDYGPLLERPLAALSGMGWFGKSTMLLAPGFGPWVMLGAIATTLDLAPDAPLAKSCGACTRCIAACPTGAISPDGGVVDARRCISYLTIELRGPIPLELRPLMGNHIFGCDDCLDACPVGAASRETHPDFAPASPDALFPPLAELLALDDEAFRARFQGRAIMRAKREGLLRNVCVALGNTGTLADLPALEAAKADASALVREHAEWAVDRLRRREKRQEEGEMGLEARGSRPEAGQPRGDVFTPRG